MSNRYVPVDSGVFDKVSGRVAPFPQSVTDEVVTELNGGELDFEGYLLVGAVQHYQGLPHYKGNRFVQHYNGVLDTETGLVARLADTPPLWLVDVFNEGCYDDNLDDFDWSTIKEETQ